MVDILLISVKEFKNFIFMYGLFVDRNMERIASNKRLVHARYADNHDQAAGVLGDTDFSDVPQQCYPPSSRSVMITVITCLVS